MVLLIQLLHFIYFPVDRHFVFFLTLRCVARFQWTSLHGSLPWPVVSLPAVSLYLWSMRVQKRLDGKFQKWAIYISFHWLAIMMKPLAVLLRPSQDVSRSFVQGFSPISHFVDVLVVSPLLWCLSASVQVTLMGPKCKSSDSDKAPCVKSSVWPVISGMRWGSWNISAENKWGAVCTSMNTDASLYVVLRDVDCWLSFMRLFSHNGLKNLCLCPSFPQTLNSLRLRAGTPVLPAPGTECWDKWTDTWMKEMHRLLSQASCFPHPSMTRVKGSPYHDLQHVLLKWALLINYHSFLRYSILQVIKQRLRDVTRIPAITVAGSEGRVWTQVGTPQPVALALFLFLSNTGTC